MLSAISHSLSSIIPVEESLPFIAQLPIFLRAVYANGRSIKAKKEKVKDVEGFINLIRSLDGKTSLFDFESDKIAEDYRTSAFLLLRKYASSGKMNDIRGELPKQLKGRIFNHIFI